ncbi:hypothetical protein A4X09_0g2593 [Tilletia walkeri]|uniref:Elongation factor 1 alpha-like protein n=1 Tax=Tilletia walkeri TaxID=117179 RepID=A0A8X7NC21_9BASI|nr:hypothetical protein A4X09_0g2593 [Tilletia walkeri]
MSRHRAVRNLDLDEELADDYDYAEDPYEDITDQERTDLTNALASVIEILGPSQASGFTDREIKDFLWDSYFDVQSAVAHFLDEQGKRQARALKKQEEEATQEEDQIASLPPPPTSEPPKPMTALQRLAAARQAKRQTATPAPAVAPASQAPAPKSKLAALVAARSSAGKASVSASTSPTPAPAPASSTPTASTTDKKPLSRLQQKIQAAQEAKAKDAAAKASGTSEGTQAVAMEIVEEPPLSSEQAAATYARTHLASGLAIGSLFPVPSVQQSLPRSFDQMQIDDEPASVAEEQYVSAASVAVTFGPSLLVAGSKPHIGNGPSASDESHKRLPRLFPGIAVRQDSEAGSKMANLRAAFDGPSPDDKVMQAREGTRLGAGIRPGPGKAAATAGEAAERKRATAASSSPAPASRASSAKATQNRGTNAKPQSAKAEPVQMSQLQSDIEGMGLTGSRNVQVGPEAGASGSATPHVPAKAALSNERIIEEWEKQQKTGKAALSLIVVGHVDAGKSTLMGKLLHELGRITDREQSANERASARIGKGSFAFAWALDSSEEERSRGVTIDIAQESFSTAHRQFTLLDAPGHRDFIPNMISGSAQADAAILVIDASLGAFEAGFGPNGQTREHALLLRSLGIQQLIVVVNKLDAVEWDQSRFDEIVEALKPFFNKSGFDVASIQFIPCGAAIGENLAERSKDGPLNAWYSGPVLVDVLDALEPPSRQLRAPLRMPLTNVFKGQTAISSGIGAAGRLISGVVQVGDRLRVVPGDETAVIRAIEADDEQVSWAVAGSNVTLYLTSIDQVHVNIGSVLCTPGAEVPICSTFLAQVLVFEPSYPLVAGSQVELFHHSANVAATLTELISITDKSTGQPTKRKPRVLSKGVTAQIRITVMAGGAAGQSRGIPVEDFKTNKEMARILLRREGETVAAGIITELSST